MPKLVLQVHLSGDVLFLFVSRVLCVFFRRLMFLASRVASLSQSVSQSGLGSIGCGLLVVLRESPSRPASVATVADACQSPVTKDNGPQRRSAQHL